MENLAEIRQNLDDVDDNLIREIFQNIKKYIKLIMTLVLLFLVIALVGIFVLKKAEERESIHRVSAKEQLLWENDQFPILDEWYEKENYEDLVKFYQELLLKNDGYGLESYKHYDFIRYYENYMCIKDLLQLFDEGKAKKEDGGFLTYHVLRVYYGEFESRYNRYTEEDLQIMEKYNKEILDCFYDRMKFTDEEAEQLRKKLLNGEYVRYEESFQYGEKIYKRFE